MFNRLSLKHAFQKKVLVLFCLTLIMLLGYTQVTYAFVEIPGYSVDVTLADDFDTLYSVRTTEITVTDSGRFNQPYDGVNFYSVYGGNYNLADLYASGYRTMVVEITMDIKEVQDGYQYIYIYDDTTSNTLLRGMQFEHFPGSKNTTYKTYTFYAEIDMANVTNNDFFIRYSASGLFNDDWKNTNVKIQVGWSTELVKTTHIWSLVWGDEAHTYYICTEWPIAS